MSKKPVKKDTAAQAPSEAMDRPLNEKGRQGPMAKQEPEPEPGKPLEFRVEEEIEKLYGDIPRGATELYLRAILRELVRARIS